MPRKLIVRRKDGSAANYRFPPDRGEKAGAGAAKSGGLFCRHFLSPSL